MTNRALNITQQLCDGSRPTAGIHELLLLRTSNTLTVRRWNIFLQWNVVTLSGAHFLQCRYLRNHTDTLELRMVIRIMLMVPLYGISSLISLFSLDAAFFIDAVRDIYEVSSQIFMTTLDLRFLLAGIRYLLLFQPAPGLPWWREVAVNSLTWT